MTAGEDIGATTMDEDDSGAAIGESVQGCRLVRCLEAGGFFVGYHWIYEAVDDSGRRVAIKLLGRAYGQDPARRDRFFRRARFMQQLGHAGVARVIDVTQHPAGMPCAILEYLSGELLGKRLQRADRMSPAAAVDITRQLGHSLGRIHEAGAVFVGLEPDGVLLVRGSSRDASLRTKLVGFTSMIFLGEEFKSCGFLPSSPHYASPELCERRSTIDGKADVYSLGALLYEMLSGRPLFQGRPTVIEIMMHHLNAPVPSLHDEVPAAPAALLRLMHEMLSKSPADRPAMPQVVAALDALAGVMRRRTA